jgi:hypothetical protein
MLPPDSTVRLAIHPQSLKQYLAIVLRMTEYKSIEVMNNAQMQIGRGAKFCSCRTESHDSRPCENKKCTSLQLTKEYKSIEAPNKITIR